MRSVRWWKLLTAPYFTEVPKEKLTPDINSASRPAGKFCFTSEVLFRN